MILSLALVQVFLPLVLIGCHAIVPVQSHAGLWLRIAAILLVLAHLAVAGLWLFPPHWTPYLLGGLHLAVSLRLVRRHRRDSRPRPRWGRLAEAAVALSVGLGAGVLLSGAVAGARVPPGAIDLAMPLGPGRYLVVNGGTDLSINAHLATLAADRTRAYRGQSFGVDIIGIDRLGLGATGIQPAMATAYHIHGAEVRAPCAGRVLRTVTGVPDNRVPLMNRAVMTGNAVTLGCGDVEIVLAHLAPGTITVRNGQHVAPGDTVGRVGNSGNSGAPHLHLHVQRPGNPDAPLSGDPVWFTVEGRFLVRNDIFEVRRRALP